MTCNDIVTISYPTDLRSLRSKKLFQVNLKKSEVPQTQTRSKKAKNEKKL